MREIHDYDLVPTLDESGMVIEVYRNAEWRKVITPVSTTRAANWGKKGEWGK